MILLRILALSSILFCPSLLALQIFLVVDRSYVFKVELVDTVDKLRDQIKQRFKWHKDDFLLTAGASVMRCGKTLKDYNLQEQSTIVLYPAFNDDHGCPSVQ